MIILNADKIKRFKDRLFQKHASLLMQTGDGKLNPIETCQKDEQENIIISTEKIIDFFFESISGEESLRPREHFANLYTLFEVFTKEIEGYAFESDLQISEKAIHEANPETTIEYLTKNLIISYFDTVRDEETGEIDTELLEKDFARLIRISSSGRDYRTLVSNTLEQLTQTLNNDDSWHNCIRNMNDAALVCNLVGARLPKIEAGVVSGFINQAREEITQTNLMLGRILSTRLQIMRDEANLKAYIKTAQKLDKATAQVLEKMNRFFFFAHNFMQLLGIPSPKFIGKENEKLLLNLACTFLGYPQDPQAANDQDGPDLNLSAIRFRMNRLFKHSELVIYCREFTAHEQYRSYYIHIFKTYYLQMDALIREMEGHPMTSQIKRLANLIFELKQIMASLELEEKHLAEEKKAVQQQFTGLVRMVNTDHLNEITALTGDLCHITHDTQGRFFESTQKALIAACYNNLTAIDYRSLKPDEFQAEIQKILFGYAVNYRPRKLFYRTFFEAYIGKTGQEAMGSFQELVKLRKPFAMALLKVLSDTKSIGHLLPEKHISYAAELLDTLVPSPGT